MQELPKAAIRSEGPSKKSNTATGYRRQLCRYKDKVVFQSLASSTQVSTLKLLGVPVEYAQPKEGAVLLNVAECTLAHNNQPALAQKLAAYLLSPEAQAPALEEGDQIPSNPKTPTTDKTRTQVAAMNAYLETAISIDWDQVNQQRPEWNARWSRTIER